MNGNTSPTRACRRCGVERDLSLFGISNTRTAINGQNPMCKPCVNEADHNPNNRYCRLVAASKKEGKTVELTREEYAAIVVLPCFFCGARVRERGRGVDRLDCGGTYNVANVVPCCGICNCVRLDIFTPTEMRNELGPAIARIRASRQLSGGDLKYPSYAQRKADSTKRADRTGRYSRKNNRD